MGSHSLLNGIDNNNDWSSASMLSFARLQYIGEGLARKEITNMFLMLQIYLILEAEDGV